MRCLLFTGKGGVGTTTVAAATATLAAQRGHRVLALSTDASRGLDTVLDHPLDVEPVEVEPGLFAARLDPQRAGEDRWRPISDRLDRLWDALGVAPLEADELVVTPGAAELLTLLHLHEWLSSDGFDVAVVDAGPTAAGLRLLTLSETLSWYLARIMPADGVLRRRRALAAGLGWFDRSAGLGVERARTRVIDAVERARVALADPTRVSVRLVLTPETVVAAEARRALRALTLHGIGVDGVIANRVHLPGASDAWRAGWAAAHREQLDVIEAAFAPVPVLRAGYRAGEPIGPAELAAFAAATYAERDPAAPLSAAAAGRDTAPRVSRDSDGFTMSLPLPFTERWEIDLARLGEDRLIVTVGSVRRLLALPSVLRRCVARGAVMRGDRLEISFVPDPALWPRTPSGARA